MILMCNQAVELEAVIVPLDVFQNTTERPARPEMTYIKVMLCCPDKNRRRGIWVMAEIINLQAYRASKTA